MKIVAVEKRPAEPRRQCLPDDALAASAHSHQDDDHVAATPLVGTSPIAGALTHWRRWRRQCDPTQSVARRQPQPCGTGRERLR
jgi:hypothetical protein